MDNFVRNFLEVRKGHFHTLCEGCLALPRQHLKTVTYQLFNYYYVIRKKYDRPLAARSCQLRGNNCRAYCINRDNYVVTIEY